jgi:hypothetical protein
MTSATMMGGLTRKIARQPMNSVDPVAEEQQRAEGQRVAGNDPLQVSRDEVQLELDGGKRYVDDAEVELQDELRRDDESERHAQRESGGSAAVSRRGRGRPSRLGRRR